MDNGQTYTRKTDVGQTDTHTRKMPDILMADRWVPVRWMPDKQMPNRKIDKGTERGTDLIH